MDDVTASIIIACQTAGAVNSISKLGFALGMLGRKALEFGQDSISVFSDLQEETQKFGIVFAGVNKGAEAVVKDLMENFGQSELSARKMLALTGDMLTGFGLGSRDVLDLSSAMAKMGADIASFSNYAGGAEGATYALTKAMLGETEQAKMLGVAIKTDTPEFRKLEKQAQSTGIYIKELERTFTASTAQEAKAISVAATIYEQKAHVLGDFARNQESIANQSRTMANRLIELKATIGGFIDSVILVGNIKGEFADTFASITGYIKENSDKWAYHISSFLNMWRGGFEIIYTVAKNAFSNVAVVGEYVWESLVQAWADAPGFFGSISEDIKNIFSNTWNALDVSFRTSFEFYSDVLHSFLKNWKSIFTDIWEVTKLSVKSIVAYFVTGIKNLGKIASSLGENFWDLLTGKKKFSEAVGGIFDSYMNAWENIGEALGKQWEGFEIGEGTKQFGKDVASAYAKATAKQMEANAKLLGEAGRNTSAYLAKNGIKLGEFTSITAGIDEVVDAYNKRQRGIEARKGQQSPLQGGVGNNENENKNLTNFSLSMKSIADQVSKFRSSSQSAVLANSVDALRLQSRVMSQSPEMKVQQSQLDTLNQIKNGIDRLIGPSRTAQTLVRR